MAISQGAASSGGPAGLALQAWVLTKGGNTGALATYGSFNIASATGVNPSIVFVFSNALPDDKYVIQANATTAQTSTQKILFPIITAKSNTGFTLELHDTADVAVTILNIPVVHVAVWR